MRDRGQEPVRHIDEWDDDGLGSEVDTLQWLVVVQHRCGASKSKLDLNTLQPVARVRRDSHFEPRGNVRHGCRSRQMELPDMWLEFDARRVTR